ncbi:MAG: hypothetical protein JJ902_08990 [Roseibium sp.]|nr:hypothetical protein [Roseibium sp.]
MRAGAFRTIDFIRWYAVKNRMSKTAEKKPAEDWPNTVKTRKELDAALEKGLESGRGTRSLDTLYRDAVASSKDG